MMQEGTYWVGDLVHVLGDAWTEFCELAAKGEGEITLRDGRKIAFHSTCWGDGRYCDRCGDEYPVDAGLIGCILTDDILEENPNLLLGHVHWFEKPFKTSYDDGVIKIGYVEIDTN